MNQPPKILLFGKSGQVGWELQRSLAPLGSLTALDTRSTEWCGDYRNLAGLADTVRRVRPDIIVSAAAHTAVDRAESEPELARTVNAEAPGVLAQEAEKLGAWLVHYSTDYVFNGSGSRPWIESDPTAPLGIYGQTKLEGEHNIQSQCRRHLIFRTSWVYAARGGNFAKTMLRLAQERDRLTVVHDQIGAPTGAELLADVTALALRSVAVDASLSGLYHLAAGGETSWHGYAQFVLGESLKAGVALKAGPEAVIAVPSTDFPTPARRPLNSRLDTTRLQAAFGVALPHWQHGVARMLAEVRDK